MKKMQNHQTISQFFLQQGSVLVISLFILLVLTIIGATAMNDTVMEERMSSNFQNGSIAYQATESGINSTFVTIAQERELVINALDVAGAMPKELKEGEEWPSEEQKLVVDEVGKIGQKNKHINVNTTSNTQVVYVEPRDIAISRAGANLEVGDGDTFAADIVELVSTGQVDNTNISRTHIQGVQRLRPGSGQAN